jgi:hypothetical protein
MDVSDTFMMVALKYGFSTEAAASTLAALHVRLSERGPLPNFLYLYRTGGTGMGDTETDVSEQRRRYLLAFRSADDALSYAQRNRLGPAPRLATLSLAQILAVMLQQSAIRMAVIADNNAGGAQGDLPPGLQIERSVLLEMLAGSLD